MSEYVLRNDELEACFDERGRLLRLVHRPSGHDYARGGDFWRLYYRLGHRYQQEVTAGENQAEVVETDGGIELKYRGLRGEDGELPFDLDIYVTLAGNQMRCGYEVANRSEDLMIKEVQLPLVGNCQLPEDHALITTAYGGCWHDDPVGYVRNKYPDRAHWYQCADHKGLQAQHVYPSLHAACNCFTLAGQTQGLYFGNHGDGFENTVHLWRLEGSDWTEFEAGMVKHLFVGPGGSKRQDGFVVSAYSGDWHAAADQYGDWARTWYKPDPKPDWIANGNFRGWHRMILKHQNGEVLHPYDRFPQIHADGEQAGIDGLFIFGWWPGGMDRMYPHYAPDAELGGEQALRDNIRRVQDELGGNVILYASGRLVDRQSDFYREHGHACSIKKASGDECGDAYLFGNRSTYERMYGAVELVPMCLECEPWIRVLEGVIDQAVDYGCKGVFFDQLGLQEHPCWDATHGHPVPYIDQVQGKRKVVEHLRDYARARDPQLAFGVEVFVDALGQYCDYVHGLYHQLYIAGNPDYQEAGVPAETVAFIDWSRYIFPDLIISDRDIRDERDFERRVNIALLRGLIHDVEVYRCRETIAQTPNYQRYLGEVNALRARHTRLLAPESYRDTLGFEIDGPGGGQPDVDARAFCHGDTMAVLVTQSHLERAEVSVHAEGFRRVELDGVGDFKPGDGNAVTLGRHAVAAVIFERNS